MADQVRRTHHLLTLRVAQLLGEDGGFVRSELYRGQELLETWQNAVEEFHLPQKLSAKVLADGAPTLPSTAAFATPLQRVVAANRKNDEPVWLQLVHPARQLPVVPWERLLLPLLGPPLLRVPNFTLDPVFAEGVVRVAVCASSPLAKSPFEVDHFVRALVEKASGVLADQPALFHVFADESVWWALRDWATNWRHPLHELRVYDPQTAPAEPTESSRQIPETGGSVDSPWLLWVMDCLKGEGVDGVHFVCPGYFTRERGALAMAQSPRRNDDPHWSHFVGAGELSVFLNWVGAWALALTSPPHSVWAPGLRLLATEVTRLRPGSVLLHEPESESGVQAAADTYGFLFGPQRGDLPRSPDISLACHPLRLARYAEPSVAFATPEADWSKVFADPRMERIVPMAVTEPRSGLKGSRFGFITSEKPVWKLAMQRTLDQQVAELVTDSVSQRPVSTRIVAERQGTARGLTFVQNLLRESEAPSFVGAATDPDTEGEGEL